MMNMYRTLLYYCYTSIDDAEAFAASHLEFCRSLDLKGRVIVAPEGLNGTISGTVEACDAYMKALRAEPRFASIDFKADEVDTPSFVKMHVRHKRSEEHTSELQSLMRISYAVFCL